MLTTAVKTSIKESVLCWLATADTDGNPNNSPKEVFTCRGDDEIIIANIASPQSVKNILVNPSVCVSFIHVLKQKGFKVKGQAQYHTDKDGDDYASLFALIAPVVKDIYPVRGIIRVCVNAVAPITAPSYFLIPDTTEQSQMAQARQTYGL